MDSRWFKGLKGDLKEDRRKEILGYRNAFDALKEFLEAEFKKKAAVRDYSPGWEHKQISVNEYNQSIDDIIKLLTIEEN